MNELFPQFKFIKIALLLLPEVIIICQLFLIGIKINEFIKEGTKTLIVEGRCYCD